MSDTKQTIQEQIADIILPETVHNATDLELTRVQLAELIHPGKVEKLVALIEAYASERERELTRQVNRIEVIDSTGRAYVKGEMYGTPVTVEVQLQDDDRTLKVFVTEKEGND